MKDESLREYITRFNNEVLEVRNVEPNLLLYFFVKGLKPDTFAKALAGEKPTSMDDLKARAEKWIRIEEWKRTQTTQAAKKDDKGNNQQNPESRGKEDKAQDKPSKGPRGMFNTYTPLTVSAATVYKEVMNSKIRDRPPPLRNPGRFRNYYCHYHREKGHSTNECVQLRDAIEKLIRQGRLGNYTQEPNDRRGRRESPNPRDRRPRSPQANRHPGPEARNRSRSPRRNQGCPPRGVIQVIAGGTGWKGVEDRKRTRDTRDSCSQVTQVKNPVLSFSDVDLP
jgi:hypothetical protein